MAQFDHEVNGPWPHLGVLGTDSRPCSGKHTEWNAKLLNGEFSFYLKSKCAPCKPVEIIFVYVVLSIGIFACRLCLHHTQLIQQNVAAQTLGTGSSIQLNMLFQQWTSIMTSSSQVNTLISFNVHWFMMCLLCVDFLHDGATSCLRHAQAELEENFL